MTSLTEDLATWLYRNLRDQGLVDNVGQWKNLSHEDKEKYRALGVRLQNFLGRRAQPEGEYAPIPEGHYRVRSSSRPYKQSSAANRAKGTAAGASEATGGEPGGTELRN